MQREINPTLFTQEEYQNRLEDGQSFLQRVMDQPKIMIKGEVDDIGKPCLKISSKKKLRIKGGSLVNLIQQKISWKMQ